MKKIFIVLFSLAILASCTNTQTPETTNTGSETQTTQTNETKNDEIVTKLVIYTLRDTDENGEILDSNTEATEALEVVMGANMVIKGFEKGLEDMKEWETKSFTVLPSEGYGEATIEQEMDIKSIAPTFAQELNRIDIEGVNKVTLTKSELNDEILKQLEWKNAGDILEETDLIKIKIIENTTEIATIEYTSKTNPFLNKELTVGLEVEDENGKYKILSIDEEKVNLQFTNKKSPFYNKEFKAGATTTTEFGDVTILEINGETVKARVPNTNHLAGKTLHFTVKVEKITTQKKEQELSLEEAANIEETNTQEQAQ